MTEKNCQGLHQQQKHINLNIKKMFGDQNEYYVIKMVMKSLASLK